MKIFKHLILFLFFLSFTFLLSVATIFATTDIIQSLPLVKQYDCVTLPQICGNCTYTNISSITYPNSSQAVGQVGMTKNGTEYNYLFCDTSTLGEYKVKGYYDKNGIVDVWNYPLEVTTTGQQNNNTVPLFFALGGFIIFIVAIFTRNLYIGFISGTVFIVLGIYLMIFGLGTMADFYTQTLSYVSLGFGLLIFLSAAYEAITDTGIYLWKKGDDSEAW